MHDALRLGPFQHEWAWRTGASVALTAALAAAVGILMVNDGRSHAEAVMAGGFAAVLVMLAAYDLADRIVPNRIVLPALALALLLSPVWHDRGPQEAFIAATGALLVGAALRSMSAGGLGWGDVKMMAFVGAVVGAPAVVLAGVVTALSGGVWALLMIVTGRVTRHTRMPYAPFIALGGLVAIMT
ncbi:MAG: hypothetical protein AMXMBFR23_02970 [Chloroflexota bacterium]